MALLQSVTSFFIVICASIISPCLALPLEVNAPNVLLTNSTVEAWLAKSDFALILFCNEGCVKADPKPLIDRFQKLGQALHHLGIHFGVYDCYQDESNQKCVKSESDALAVHTYLKGDYLVDLSADSLFNEHSIISNSLQLLLIHEVPLIQTAEALGQRMLKSVMKSEDFLFMFVPGIGTQEHSSFMQLARLALATDDSSLRFAHSTTPDILADFLKLSPTAGLAAELGVANQETKLFYVNCKDTALTKNVKCPLYQYLGTFDQESVFAFMEVIVNKPTRKDAISDTLTVSGIVTCYYSNEEEKVVIEDLVHKLEEEMKGVVLVYSLSRSEGGEEEVLKLEPDGPVCSMVDKELGVKEHTVDLVTVRSIIIATMLKPKVTGKKEGHEEELTGIDAIIKEVEKIDDSVEQVDKKLGHSPAYLELSHLNTLTRDSFDEKTHDGVVLFHIMKYNHRNRVVLKMYADAALQLPDHTFSILNCYDWTDVCKKINIAKLPTIKIYKRGVSFTYNGPLSTASFVRLATLSTFSVPHKVTSMSELVTTRQTCLDSKLDVIIIGLFKDDDSKACKAYEQAAGELVGQRLMIVAIGDMAELIQGQFSLPDLPVIMFYNPSQMDRKKAIGLYDKPTYSKERVKEYALTAGLPSFVELTPESLPLLRIRRKPQLIFFADSLNNDLFATIDSLSTDKSVKNKFGFTYLIVPNSDVNQRVLESLADGPLLPALVVADYQKGKVFKYEADLSKNEKQTSEDIKKWLLQISIGNIAATKDLSGQQWKPLHPGFDYLELVAESEKKKKAKHDRLNLLPKEEGEEDGEDDGDNDDNDDFSELDDDLKYPPESDADSTTAPSDPDNDPPAPKSTTEHAPKHTEL